MNTEQMIPTKSPKIIPKKLPRVPCITNTLIIKSEVAASHLQIRPGSQ